MILPKRFIEVFHRSTLSQRQNITWEELHGNTSSCSAITFHERTPREDSSFIIASNYRIILWESFHEKKFIIEMQLNNLWGESRFCENLVVPFWYICHICHWSFCATSLIYFLASGIPLIWKLLDPTRGAVSMVQDSRIEDCWPHDSPALVGILITIMGNRVSQYKVS